MRPICTYKLHIKDTYKHSNGPCKHSKEPCTHTKEPYRHPKEPYRHTKEPCIYLHETIDTHTRVYRALLSVWTSYMHSRTKGLYVLRECCSRHTRALFSPMTYEGSLVCL